MSFRSRGRYQGVGYEGGISSPLVLKWQSLRRAIHIIGRSKGAQGMRTPRGPNSFIFIQFSAKNLQNNPNLTVGSPPSGKFFTATAHYTGMHSCVLDFKTHW